MGQDFPALTPVSAVPTAVPATCFLSTYHQSHPYEALRMEKIFSWSRLVSHLAQMFLTRELWNIMGSMEGFQEVLELLETKCKKNLKHTKTLFWGKDPCLPSESQNSTNPIV